MSEVQAALHRAFRGGDVDAVASEVGVDPKRLAIYQAFVRDHIDTVLDQDFPMVRTLVPRECWEALLDGYFEGHPATNWELNRAAEAFPAYVAERAAGGLEGVTAFHADLAAFEWEQLVAFVHPAVMPDPGELDAPALNPTLAVLSLAHPVIEVAEAYDDDALDAGFPIPEAVSPPEVVLVFRHPTRNVTEYLRATDDLLFAVKVVHEGLDPAEAAKAAGATVELAEAAIGQAVEAGLAIRPASGR